MNKSIKVLAAFVLCGPIFKCNAWALSFDEVFPYEITRGVSDGSVVLSESGLLHVALQVTRSDKVVRVQRAERPNASAAWDTASVELTTSFQITSVSGNKGGNVVYVAGIKADGNDIVERWNFNYRDGAMTTLNLPSGGVLGAPSNPPLLGVHSLSPASWATGTRGSDLLTAPFTVPYSPPPHRGGIPSPHRTVIFDPESNVGHIRNIVVDPEGRFLLLQMHDTGELYRWDLNSLSFPVSESAAFTDLVADLNVSTGIPFLSNNGLYMRIYDHPNDGRVLLLRTLTTGTSATGTWVVALKDTNNDGIWNTNQTWGVLAWVESAYEALLVPAYPH